MKEGRICIWGDSITWGASDYEKGGWVNRLRLYADNQIHDDIDIYNLGVSGDTTEDLIERFEIECKVREPKVIIFAIGINDTYSKSNVSSPVVSLHKFRENIFDLIDIAKKFTTKIGFIGLTRVDEHVTMPVSWDESVYYTNQNIEIYDKELRNIVMEKQQKYLDMSEVLGLEDLEDGLHPNALGHEKIYRRIKQFIFETFV